MPSAVASCVPCRSDGSGIYPDDHWEHATELTPDTADAWVQENVDAGKTALIRWIASEG